MKMMEIFRQPKHMKLMIGIFEKFEYLYEKYENEIESENK
jgi:hypothetical protein